ncbi:anthrone oxygenase family protein [Saccharopolyspora sp. NPDC002578]
MIDSPRLASVVLLLATLTTGLQAGTYYIFACGVMPGLELGDDRTFVAAMQQFNVAFINPWFLATFLGAPALALIAVVTHRRTHPALWASVSAGFLLAMATVVITSVVHFPLNAALDAAGPPDRAPNLHAVREANATTWTGWNTARALTSTAALAALSYALLTTRTRNQN